MSIRTQLYSLSKIFTERLLRIPDYQRGYAWTEKQLKDFWSDLDQLEHDRNHYTGVLTLEEVPENILRNWHEDIWIIRSKGFTPLYVVDGQQRLTTSIILIQAILETAPEGQKINYTSLDDIRRKFIYDSKDDGISRSYLFGYEKDNPSYEFLKTRIFLEKSDNAIQTHETIYTYNLEVAKKFFLDRLKESTFSSIEQLYKKLTQQFLFNVYSISEDVDVHVAFETMNNRGKPLSHLELLKNRLVYLSTKLRVQDFERSKLRTAINESWKSVYHFLGKNKERPLEDDVFLQNHFILYFGDLLRDQDSRILREMRYIRSRGRFLSGGFEDYLLDHIFTQKNLFAPSDQKNSIAPLTTMKMYTYVQSLKDSVQIWYELLNPQDSSFSDEEKVWLQKLNRLGGLYLIAPLLMAFYQKDASAKMRVRLLRVLERYLFVLTLNAPMIYPGFEDIKIYELANQLSKGEIASEKVVKDFEQHVDTNVAKKEVIEQIISEMRGQSFYEWRPIKYFLFEYELHLKTKSKTSRDKLIWESFVRDLIRGEDEKDFRTVEHIYPQHAKKPCWTEPFAKYSDRERRILKHSLGNLLPLSQPKNSSFQNQCFEAKKGKVDSIVGYRYGSYSEIEVANVVEWTARSILERGVRLLEFMEYRWKISFGDRANKIKLLGLEFVEQKEVLTH